MNKIKDFLNSWTDLLMSSLNIKDNTEEEKKILKDRLNICHECEYRKRFYCGVCGCPLLAKVRSLNSCPKNKW